MGIAGLGSLDPNVFPLDAIELQEESPSSKIIAGRDEWRFGSAISGSEWVTARAYKAGDIVWNPADKLTYVALVDNSSVEPDYSDTGVEGVTWEWIAGSVTGFVSNRGWWQKHADGTLEQWFELTVSSLAISTAYGSLYRSAAVQGGGNWPIQFTSLDTAYWATRITSGTSAWIGGSSTDATLTVTPTFFIISGTNSTLTSGKFVCYGRGSY